MDDGKIERQVYSVSKRQFFLREIHSESASVPGLRYADRDATTDFISAECG